MKILKYLFIATCILIISTTVAYVYLDFSQEPYSLDFSKPPKTGTYIKLSEGYTRYEISGPDTGKLIVLIPGAGIGYYVWNKNFDYLVSKGYRVLRYDLYGRGYSERLNKEYTEEILTNQLSELINTFSKNNKKTTLISASMGSTVALNYADHFKDKVERLILIDPASLGMSKAPWYISTPLVSDLLFTFYWRPRAVEKQMNEYFNPSAVSEYRAINEDQMKYKGYKNTIRSTWIHVIPLDKSKELQTLYKDSIKLNLIWGKNDPLVTYKAAEEYIKLVPNASLDLINNAGHLACYEQGTQTNSIIYKILNNEK